jgi:hypothetical protein
VCFGVAGPVDRAMAERLQTLLRELHVRTSHELVISLAGLGPWHPQLARALAHARIQYLVHGAHVELHDLPDALAAELGLTEATTFLVEDTVHVDPPGEHDSLLDDRFGAQRHRPPRPRPRSDGPDRRSSSPKPGQPHRGSP